MTKNNLEVVEVVENLEVEVDEFDSIEEEAAVYIVSQYATVIFEEDVAATDGWIYDVYEDFYEEEEKIHIDYDVAAEFENISDSTKNKIFKKIKKYLEDDANNTISSCFVYDEYEDEDELLKLDEIYCKKSKSIIYEIEKKFENVKNLWDIYHIIDEYRYTLNDIRYALAEKADALLSNEEI